MLAALALLLAVTGAAMPACEDDSVFRSGDPPPSIGPDGGTADDGAGDAGGSAGASGSPDSGND
jgi:hypothetical protein